MCDPKLIPQLLKNYGVSTKRKRARRERLPERLPKSKLIKVFKLRPEEQK